MTMAVNKHSLPCYRRAHQLLREIAKGLDDPWAAQELWAAVKLRSAQIERRAKKAKIE